MAMSATGSRDRASGSTLIELLVGLVIASVMLGAAVMAFPRTDERRADQAAAQAQALIELACERAVLTGEDVGFGIDQSKLVFGAYRSGEWQAFPDSPQEALRPRVLDKDVTLELRVDDPMQSMRARVVDGTQAWCLASGESTPFVLGLRGPARQQRSLRGDGSAIVQQEDGDAR
jgi:type II secretory pathway pseudopilin PulG